MKIVDKKIAECTEQELIDNWISSGYMDVMPFYEYKAKCELLGTKIVEDSNETKSI